MSIDNKNQAEEHKLSDAFSRIYEDNVWGDPNSRSGAGSNMEQTRIIREKIPGLLTKYQIKSIVDAPCGDLYWIQTLFPWFQKEGIKYTGLEIVPDMVAQNKLHFSSTGFNFYTVDLTKGPIPLADLIMTRDCFLHLSYKNILTILTNYKKSGSKYLLVSTYIKSSRKNYDVHDFPVEARPINLQLFPFNFNPPLEVIVEGCTEGHGEMSDKSLALWDLNKIDTDEIGKAIQKITSFQNSVTTFLEKGKRRYVKIVNRVKKADSTIK